MLEALKNAVSKAVDALRQNGEHRASLADALEAAHETVHALEQRVAALEARIEAGFTAAAPLATLGDSLVEAVTGAAPAAVQVETKPAA
ncbi:hypothetical protein QZM43_09800 [Burkholderia orbicola]|uniref:hypothetical protein n=1 Tax=Burkholderia orbicola TaxID=2978683 RepID=UPI002654D571|nr:hypothetical protein [Burkholderia orbicola]ELW9447696.1 hypothetical protein [Burkholderia cenocepacia]MDN7467428.1 hypothetical protein [Burkholderia orbicola]MDN7503018.1 hypothetical protein [Burkholderia orbicola]